MEIELEDLDIEVFREEERMIGHDIPPSGHVTTCTSERIPHRYARYNRYLDHWLSVQRKKK